MSQFVIWTLALGITYLFHNDIGNGVGDILFVIGLVIISYCNRFEELLRTIENNTRNLWNEKF